MTVITADTATSIHHAMNALTAMVPRSFLVVVASESFSTASMQISLIASVDNAPAPRTFFHSGISLLKIAIFAPHHYI